MDRKKALIPALAAAAMFAASPLAIAGDRDGDDGWAHHGCHCDCGCEGAQEVHLGDGFFADAGGVGPAFPESFSGGGGAAEAITFAGANASAFASASARVSVAIRVQNHQMMMMKMHMMKMRMPKHW
ncbi:MAG TPA: hypothetical protein VKU90_13895 [Caulobacteraceae bacterium]|nr:hypothetical protein [Caulobacteraceae bacterium]